jgi:hypothetical protein
MIKYQLICDLTHEFEGWFQTGADFDAQNEAGLVTCPVCDSFKVRRALMTPNLASPKRRRDDVPRLPMAETGHQAGTIAPSSQTASAKPHRRMLLHPSPPHAGPPITGRAWRGDCAASPIAAQGKV